MNLLAANNVLFSDRSMNVDVCACPESGLQHYCQAGVPLTVERLLASL